MEQISVDANKVQGAARQHTKEFDIRKWLADLMRADPTLSRDEAIHAGVDRVLKALGVTRAAAKDLGPLLAFCDYGVTNNYRMLVEEGRRGERSVSRPIDPAIEEPVRRRPPQPIVITSEEIAAQAKVEIGNALMKIILPSGRSLYDSTREEIVAFRGQQTKLIGLLKLGQTPRQAGITSL